MTDYSAKPMTEMLLASPIICQNELLNDDGLLIVYGHLNSEGCSKTVSAVVASHG